MHVNDALRVEIERELNGLKNMEVGSEDLANAVNDVTRLMDRKIEMDRAENEAYDKAEDRKAEQRNRMIGHIITGISVVGGMAVSIWGFKKSIEFEKTGTITTFVGRIMNGRVLGKK